MKSKTTDTIQSLETKMTNEVAILKDPNVGKERKREAMKKIKLLEKHFANVDSKLINGKKYGERLYHSGPEPMNKKEVLKLIDSVEVDPKRSKLAYIYNVGIDTKLDLSGVSVGKDRFIFIE